MQKIRFANPQPQERVAHSLEVSEHWFEGYSRVRIQRLKPRRPGRTYTFAGALSPALFTFPERRIHSLRGHSLSIQGRSTNR